MRVTEMGRRYLSVLLKLFFDRILVSDDLLSERAASRARNEREGKALGERLGEVESALGLRQPGAPAKPTERTSLTVDTGEHRRRNDAG